MHFVKRIASNDDSMTIQLEYADCDLMTFAEDIIKYKWNFNNLVGVISFLVEALSSLFD